MLIRCSDCKEVKDKKEVNCILGVWVCKDCYPIGHLYSDDENDNSLKERLSDFSFAEVIYDICNSRVKDCGIFFNSEFLILSSNLVNFFNLSSETTSSKL